MDTDQKKKTADTVYLILGILFTIIGLVGLLLPVMPVWLFLIPAAYCFFKLKDKKPVK